MAKLNLKKSCFDGIKSEIKEIKQSDKHEELLKQSKIEIEKGNLKYAKAIINSRKYYCKSNQKEESTYNKVVLIDEFSKLEICNNDKLIINYKIINEKGIYSDFSLLLFSDININAYTEDDNTNEITFVISEYNPLYIPLVNFLNQEKKIRIASDLRREECDDLCYIEISKEENITISFINKIDDACLLDKFNYVVINTAYDLRSKLDQKNTDYKKRLLKLFEDIILIAKNQENSKVLKMDK